MVRATWKIPVYNMFLIRQLFSLCWDDPDAVKDFRLKIPYLWKTAGVIVMPMHLKQVLLHRGNRWLKLNLLQKFTGVNIGEYLFSKYGGRYIHSRISSKSTRGRKRSKGILAHPLGQRLQYQGSWHDGWCTNDHYFPQYLHKAIALRKYITAYMLRERWKLTSFLVSNIDVTGHLGSFHVSVTMYLGKLRDAWYNDEWEWAYYTLQQWRRFFMKKLKRAWKHHFRWKTLMQTLTRIRHYKFRKYWRFLYKILNKYIPFHRANYLKVYHFGLNERKHIKKTFKNLNYFHLKNFVMIRLKYNNRFRKFFYGLSTALAFKLTVIASNPVAVSLLSMSNDSITAEMMGRYFIYKLRDKFQVKDLFNPIKKELEYVTYACVHFVAWRIKLIGRFKRRQRRKIWKIEGGPGIGLSTTTVSLDYYQTIVVMQHSSISIKVFLVKRPAFDNDMLCLLAKSGPFKALPFTKITCMPSNRKQTHLLEKFIYLDLLKLQQLMAKKSKKVEKEKGFLVRLRNWEGYSNLNKISSADPIKENKMQNKYLGKKYKAYNNIVVAKMLNNYNVKGKMSSLKEKINWQQFYKLYSEYNDNLIQEKLCYKYLFTMPIRSKIKLKRRAQRSLNALTAGLDSWRGKHEKFWVSFSMASKPPYITAPFRKARFWRALKKKTKLMYSDTWGYLSYWRRWHASDFHYRWIWSFFEKERNNVNQFNENIDNLWKYRRRYRFILKQCNKNAPRKKVTDTDLLFFFDNPRYKVGPRSMWAAKLAAAHAFKQTRKKHYEWRPIMKTPKFVLRKFQFLI